MTTKKPKRRDLVAWSLLIILSLVWGSSFILIKKSLLAFSAMQVGAGRIAISFIAFIPLFFRFYKKIDKRKLLPLLIVGLCGSGLPALLYATAQTKIPSGIAGLLNAMTPIFAFLIGVVIFQKGFSWRQLVGISLGFLGTLLIFYGQGCNTGGFPLAYGFMIVLATFCYGISANTVGHFLSSVPPLMISTISFMLIGPFALAYLLQSGFLETIASHEQGAQSMIALSILSLVGTFGANILFFKLIQLTDPVFSSSVSFIIPIVALLWGLWDGESFHVYFFLALLLISVGVFLVKFRGNN